MRVYLSCTLPLLAHAHRTGRYAEAGAVAHAVTPGLREWYTEGGTEELEYAALLDAAEGSLRLLAAEHDAPRRRVVVAAEVPASMVQPSPTEPEYSSGVVLAAPVEARHVVSVHVDDEQAEADVAAAAAALPAAARGDDDARFVVDGADAHDLLWYDVTEVPTLLPP
ncbi:MAG: DUF6912 family protein [Actinomycetota bacterium]